MNADYARRRNRINYQKKLRRLFGSEWKEHDNKEDCKNFVTGVVGNARKVEQIEIETGAVVKLHNSLTSAAKELGVSSIKAIWKVCNGEIKTAYGFKWRYA